MPIFNTELMGNVPDSLNVGGGQIRSDLSPWHGSEEQGGGFSRDSGG